MKNLIKIGSIIVFNIAASLSYAAPLPVALLINAIPIADNVTVENTSGTVTWVPSVADIDGPSPLTCTIQTYPIDGYATVASDCSSGTYQTPYPGFSGIETFTYTAFDGQDTSAAATVTVTNISCTDVRPTPVDFYGVTEKNTPINWSVGVTYDGPFSVSAYCYLDPITDTGNGIIEKTGSCSGTYTPYNDFIGTESFGISNEITVNCGGGIYYFNFGPTLGVAIDVVESPPTTLPDNTILSIDPGVNTVLACATGSCFGMEVAAGFPVWTGIEPGTDGGIIVGKSQMPGSQINGVSSTASDTGELTAAWFFFAKYGTFSTAAITGGIGGAITNDATVNSFGTTSCADASCVGVTELGAWHAAWNGVAIPLGNAEGCLSQYCRANQLAGINTNFYNITLDATGQGTYELRYSNVVPDGDPSGFGGVRFSLVLRGTVSNPIENETPIASDVSAVGFSEDVISWVPDVSDTDGPSPLTCSIQTPASNGTATVATNCSSGTYQSNPGFVDVDSFTYTAFDGQDRANATVTIANQIRPMPGSCIDDFPLVMRSITGSKGTITIDFIGNIISSSKKKIKICPATKLEYKVTSSNGGIQCKLKSSATNTSGSLIVGDKIKCKDNQPTGSGTSNGHDKIKFKIKSGI